jgi:hypothetical protein
MRKPVRSWLTVVAVAAVAAAPVALSSGVVTQAAASTSKPSAIKTPLSAGYLSKHAHINCEESSAMCTEVSDSQKVFGYYVGHDEPSMLFNSYQPGSGNHMRYNVILPTDPSAANPNRASKSYQFELSGADWFGLAMCDTQSYPEQVSTCPPDSDNNVLDPTVSPKHVGEAYMEMQFYPPGWIPWPTWRVAVGASSCDPTKWCAALNIDSLSLNPVTGQQNNATCENQVGEEYVNFAFISKNGKVPGPANPVDATNATFTPNSNTLFMNSGDHVSVGMTDTPNGFKVTLNDATTGQSGTMTASKANGFAEVKFDPNGTSCTAIPTNFHPMYSTSNTKTRVTWAAGSYNAAMDTEIGHFQFCTGPVQIPATQFGLLPNGNPTSCPSGDMEGRGQNKQAPDSDDIFCFPGSEALVYKVAGCTFTNTGFDGASYQRLWPNGNTKIHPTPFKFTSPTTGTNYTQQYKTVGFETDLPDIEQPICNRSTGVGCTLIPQTDKGLPAVFYPFYTIQNYSGHCYWQFGNDIPGEINNFGQNNEYGALLQQSYTNVGGGGPTVERYNDFRNIIPNPCPQT